MAGWKQWLSGEVVEHTDLQTYIQDQVVQVYAGTAARSSVIGTALSEGMVSYLEDTNQLQYYDGSSWLTLDTGTDPAIFTAGVSGQLLSSLGTAGVAWLNQGSVVAGSASLAGAAGYATSAGTAEYSTTSGTAVYATNAGTAVGLSGTIAATQVTDTAVTQADTGTVTNAMLAGSIANDKLVNSGITLNGTAVPLGGSATISGGTAGGFTNPMTNLGDLIVGGTAGVAERLGVGTAGQYLTTNGTTVSWGAVSGGSLPTQTGNAGELLITDGTAASWSNTVTANSASVSALVVRAASGQTENLQTWQDSSGTNFAQISATGNIGTKGVLRAGFDNSSAHDGEVLLYSDSTRPQTVSTVLRSTGGSASAGQGAFSINSASVTLSGALTANPAAPANANTAKAVGYVGMPQVALASGGLTLSATHAGDHIYVTGTGQTITIPANSSVPFEIGTTIVIINAASVTTTIAITTDTLLLAGAGTTGSRTLAAHGMATLVKITSTSWIISGNGLT